MKDINDETPQEQIDEESLLVRHLLGEPPRDQLRQRALQDSTAAFVEVQRLRAGWRKARLAAAAGFIAAAAFLGGRLSMPTAPVPGISQGPTQVADSTRMSVPAELVDWLAAAQLFRQLGMHERMARAVERASSLMPAAAIAADTSAAQMIAEQSTADPGQTTDFTGVPGPRPQSESLYHVLAQSFGD